MLCLGLVLLAVTAEGKIGVPDHLEAEETTSDEEPAGVADEETTTSEPSEPVEQARPLSPGDTQFYAAINQLYIERNFTAAIEHLHLASDKGHGKAMSLLAMLYSHGIGVQRSEAKAVLYHTFAALGGSLESHMSLSHRHEHGIGVPQSCHKAVRHAKVAADAVATRHTSNINAKVDAIDLERESHHIVDPTGDLFNAHYFRAEKGAVASKMFLGYAYMLGLNGAQQDGNLAEAYFKEAAEAGDAAAHGALGQLYSQGVANANPPIERDIAMATYHFQQGAEKNHPVSLNGLGFLYAKGEGVDQDFEQAATYFSRSAQQQNAEGIYNLGVLHLNGKGVRKDVNLATQHFLQAAVRGSVLANWQLGRLNLNGEGGVPKSCTAALRNYRLVTERGPWMKRFTAAYESYHKGDYPEALIDYLVAAESGFEVGLRNAAFLLHRGHTFDDVAIMRGNHTMTQEEATTQVLLALLHRAAREGNHEAHLKLGDAYYTGTGEEVDYAKAEEHYQIAAASHNPQALFNLGLLHQFGGHNGIRQDFHLAKRYFDQAYAVKAALFGLNFQWWYNHFREQPNFGLTNIATSQLLPTLPQPWGMPLDTFVLYLCTGLVALLLLLRHHAVVEEAQAAQ